MSRSDIVYPISPAYCAAWTVPDALRELIANAFDQNASFTHRWADGTLTLADRGAGIPRSALVLGNSTGRDDDQVIGQFGEGLKVGASVCARERRGFEVQTVGYRATAAIRYEPELDSDVMVIQVVANRRRRGTVVQVACSQAEAEEALSRFLVVRHGRRARPAQGRILADEPAGTVYVLGVKVQQATNMAFAYNLTSKRLQNRDRTVIEESARDDEIGALWASCRDTQLIARLLRAVAERDNSVEAKCHPYLDDAVRGAWRRAAKAVAGDDATKICVTDPWGSSDEESRARYLGWTVLKFPSGIASALRRAGISSLGDALAEARRPQWLKLAELDGDERRHFTHARRIARRLYPQLHDVRVRVFSQIAHEDTASGQTLGLWMGDKRTVAVRRSQLQRLDETCATVLHEYAHAASGASDCSSAFEQELTSLSGRLAAGAHRTPRRRRNTATPPLLTAARRESRSPS